MQESDLPQPAVCGVGLRTDQSQHADAVRSPFCAGLVIERVALEQSEPEIRSVTPLSERLGFINDCTH